MSAAPLVVVVGHRLSFELDADQPQQHVVDAGVLAHRHLGDAFDLGAAQQPVVDQHQLSRSSATTTTTRSGFGSTSSSVSRSSSGG